MSEHKCGVYAIQHIESGNFYIGSSSRVAKRWYEHRRALNSGTHHASYLQNAWVKYGPGGFVFFVLEECAPQELLPKEQEYLDAFQPAFNTVPKAGSKLGYRLSLEERSKFQKALRDKAHARVTSCRQGHAYTPENTYTDPDGARRCRECQNEALLRVRQTHPEKIKAYKRTGYLRHRAKLLPKMKEYQDRPENKARKREYDRLRRERLGV
jgi:group I intron endonuclease